MSEIPRMLSVDETAATFGISKYYARQLALTGKVHAVRIGRGKLLLNAASVAAYFNNARLTDVETNAPAGGIRPIPAKL